MSEHTNIPTKEKGNAIMLSAIAIMIAMLALAQAIGTQVRQKTLASDAKIKSAYVASIASRIQSAYAITISQLNTANIASAPLSALVTGGDTQPVSGAAILNGIGELSPHYGLKVASSNSISLGFNQAPVARIIAIWIPPTGHVDTSSINPVTGVFTADPSVLYQAQVNGVALQTSAYGATQDALTAARQSFQRYFVTRRLATGNDAQNFYRAANCGTPLPVELPCLDTPTTLTASMVNGAGINFQGLLDGWGGTLQFANPNSGNAPFTASISAQIPYGAVGSGNTRLLTTTIDQP
ncbi:hypothetical protein ICN48_10715 [Polynucleobacter sp. JS-Safj-400b-B2]|uniref:hypothetical protein n=1 Tax=Polynucleobacter sp. JS-Safj-400b-B2 TaxID=2576921 RepID=UPI001C0C2806|nr:hypothetical protein [Polynucleobacter sp. JS-Safj-400b-B2]MBU3626702.1 hypothetical protein [Polynucleobacter sp. JS-Safj-400b-B2]